MEDCHEFIVAQGWLVCLLRCVTCL